MLAGLVAVWMAGEVFRAIDNVCLFIARINQ